MDDEELSRRGPQLVLGSLALTLGGLVALLDLQYFTQDTALVTGSGRALAMLMAVAAVIVVCGVLCVVRVVPSY